MRNSERRIPEKGGGKVRDRGTRFPQPERDAEEVAQQHIRDHYARLASRYDQRWNAYLASTHAPIIAALPLKEEDRLLDVPCGTGELGRRLLQLHPRLRYIGVDGTPAMLEQARGKFGSASTVQLIEAMLPRLPLDEGSMDAVVCASALHYFRAPTACLAEIARVTRPGGEFVLVDWCSDDWWTRQRGRWLRWRKKAVEQIYGQRAMEQLVSGSGFRIVESRRFRASGNWAMCLVRGARNQGKP